MTLKIHVDNFQAIDINFFLPTIKIHNKINLVSKTYRKGVTVSSLEKMMEQTGTIESNRTVNGIWLDTLWRKMLAGGYFSDGSHMDFEMLNKLVCGNGLEVFVKDRTEQPYCGSKSEFLWSSSGISMFERIIIIAE